MPVVSYAIPALVAIGQARYFHAPPRNPITRLVRWLSINRSLKVLRRMQPDSGGYLEATPLTSFVVMSLASIVVRQLRVQRSSGREMRHATKSSAKASSSSSTPSAPTAAGRSTRTSPPGTRRWRSTPWPARARMSPNARSARKCLDWLLSCQHTQAPSLHRRRSRRLRLERPLRRGARCG